MCALSAKRAGGRGDSEKTFSLIGCTYENGLDCFRLTFSFGVDRWSPSYNILLQIPDTGTNNTYKNEM